jgi:hypothetical protein
MIVVLLRISVFIVMAGGKERKKERKEKKSRCLVLLVEFAIMRKATISFTSVLMEQLGLHYTDFLETGYLNIFGKYVEKIQVP